LDPTVRKDEVELHRVVPLYVLLDKCIIELPFPGWVLHHVPVSSNAHAEVDARLLIHTLLLIVPHVMHDDVVYCRRQVRLQEQVGEVALVGVVDALADL